jgi:hypothetical protein
VVATYVRARHLTTKRRVNAKVASGASQVVVQSSFQFQHYQQVFYMRSRISTVYTQRASGKKQVARFEKGMVCNNKEKKKVCEEALGTRPSSNGMRGYPNGQEHHQHQTLRHQQKSKRIIRRGE